MKNYKKILASVLAVSMVASFASFSVSAATSHAYGTVIYEEDFDDLTAITEAGMVYHNDNSNGRGNISLADDPAGATGDKALGVNVTWTGTTATCSGAILTTASLNDDGAGVYLVEYDIYTPSNVTQTGVKLTTAVSTKRARACYGVSIDAAGKGTIKRSLSGAEGTATGISSLQLNQWARMAYIIDLYNLKMTYYVNGQYIGQKALTETDIIKTDAETGESTRVGIAQFIFGDYKKGARSMYYDNIKITRFEASDVVVTAPSIVSATGKTGLFYSTLTAAQSAETTVLACQAVNYNTTGTNVVTPVAAAYKAGQLVAVVSGDAVTLNNAAEEGGVARTTISLDVLELLGEDADEIKLFVWDGLTTMVPVGTTVTIK